MTNYYCTKCGQQLETWKVQTGKYDAETGQPLYRKRMKCPSYKTSLGFFGNGHDNLLVGKWYGDVFIADEFYT